MSLYFGIDFGTSTNYVTKWSEEKNKVEPVSNMDSSQYGAENSFPNVIYYQPSGKAIIGGTAYEKFRIDPDNCVYAVKRHIGEDRWNQFIPNLSKSLSASEITRDIFKCIKDKISNNYAGQKIDGVVISVPYSYQNRERAQIRKAAEDAGLNVIGLIEEPVAAALSYGLFEKDIAVGTRERVLIFDLGGGTFDVTIFEFIRSPKGFIVEVINTAGDKNLGGNDVDELLKNHFVEDVLQIPVEDRMPKYQNDILKISKDLKESLSECDSEMVFGVYGTRDLECEVQREEVQDILESNGFIAKIIDCLEEAIYDVDLEPEAIDKVILVGGSSNIPIIRDKLTEFFGKEPIDTGRPEELVGEGAAVFCGLKVSNSIELEVVPKISYAIGVKVGTKFEAVLPKNSKYQTYSDTKYLSIAETQKGTVSIDIYQGNSRSIQKCCLVGSIDVDSTAFQERKIGIQLGTNENGSIVYKLFDINGHIVDQNTL